MGLNEKINILLNEICNIFLLSVKYTIHLISLHYTVYIMFSQFNAIENLYVIDQDVYKRQLYNNFHFQ